MAHGMSVRVNASDGAYTGQHRQTRRNRREKAAREKTAVQVVRELLRDSPAAKTLAVMSDDEVLAAIQSWASNRAR